MTPTLQTPRLRLEPISEAHAPALQSHFATWDIIQHLSKMVPWPYPEDGVLTFLREDLEPRIARGHAYAWALVPHDHGEAIGLLEYRCHPEAIDNRGFWIAVPWQGRGLMTEAVIAFQDWVFFELGAPRLFVLNAVINERSRRIKEKTGARLLDTLSLAHHSGCTETQRWELTAEAWAAHRGRSGS